MAWVKGTYKIDEIQFFPEGYLDTPDKIARTGDPWQFFEDRRTYTYQPTGWTWLRDPRGRITKLQEH